jgi:hypothetical protein
MKNPRKHYSAAGKVAILRRQLVERVPLSNLCDQCHIRPSMFYNRQKQFFENRPATFEQTRSAPEKHEERGIPRGISVISSRTRESRLIAIGIANGIEYSTVTR